MSAYDHDKYYIGITSQKEVYDRWGKNGSSYKGQPFYRAIQKYGWENFEHIVITFLLEKEEACHLEKLLIQYFNSMNWEYGYNKSSGGENGYRIDSLVPILQFDLKYNFIAKYKSIADASNILGIKKTNISACCKKRQHSSGGYIFEYEDESVLNYTITKKIKQYDLCGNYLSTFENISKASSKTNIGENIIYKALNKESHFGKGFLWTYENDNSPTPYKINYITTSGIEIPVVQIKDNIIISVFNCGKDAQNKLNLDSTSISRCCRGKQHQTQDGSTWKFLFTINKDEYIFISENVESEFNYYFSDEYIYKDYVICLDTKEVFQNRKQAAIEKNVSIGSLIASIERSKKNIGKQKTHIWNNHFHWQSYLSYLKENNLSKEEAFKSLIFVPKIKEVA